MRAGLGIGLKGLIAPSSGLITESGALAAAMASLTASATGTVTASGPPTSNLALRIRASNAVQSAGIVVSCADESGTGDSNKNVVAHGSPVYNATDASANNQPTFGFTSGNYLNNVLAWSTPLTQGFTVYLFGKTAQAAGYEGFFSNQGSEGECGFWGRSGGLVEMEAPSVVNHAFNITSPHIVCLVFNGASSSIYIDDHTTPVVTGNAGASGYSQMMLGTDRSNGDPLNGSIAEILMYQNVDDAAARLAAGNYIKNTYGGTWT